VPATIKDVRDFFNRHPEYENERETTMRMAQGSSNGEGVINSGAIDWIFAGQDLPRKFMEELDCIKF